MKLYETLEKQLKKENNFVTDNEELKKWVVINKAQNFDAGIIELLLGNKELKKKFFVDIKGTLVFNQNLFVQFLEQKNYLNDSYTQYKNKVGLTIDGKYLKQRNEVALVWPFKDCVLEGGQSREEDKREEIFFNEILAQDEITQLLEPKVLTNAKTFDKDGEHPFKGFTRDAELNKKRGLPEDTITDNLIIKGNNLLALHSLKKEFAEKVKLIYIDPPYNTGNDGFKYNDNFNHSTWLTFMKNRLEVAKELLRDDGVIFVQCDDNEQAYLKVLMDDIFERKNFINIISAKMKNIAGASGGGEDKRLKKNIEFLTIFSKNYDNSCLKSTYEYTEIFDLVEEYKRKKISWKYTSVLFDKGVKEYIKSTKDGEGNEIKIYKRINPVFKSVSQIAKEENISPKKVYYKYIDSIFTTAMPQSSIRKRVLSTIKDDIPLFLSIEYVPRTGKNKGKTYEQFYKGDKLRLLTWLSDVIEKKDEEILKKDLQGTFWDGFNLNNLSKEGDTVFESGKKPEELIQRIIEMATQKGDIVLDFHLGSGTTCAVAHKMGRHYIGVEQMDYGNNDSIVRLQNVVKGDTTGISNAVNWKGGGSFTYLELKKYNQTFIEQIEEAKDSKTLLKIWEEMKAKSFLNYNVDIQKQDEHIEEFKQLSIEEQKQHLVEILDKNQLYVNLSSVNDKDFEVSKEEKQVTNDFYQIKE